MTPTEARLENTERPQLTYSMHGFPTREVLLLKSMFRLLSHRTCHNWVYSAQSTQLRVVTEGFSPAEAEPYLGKAHQLLMLGTRAAGDWHSGGYLRLPLRANQLEGELNKIGALIQPTTSATLAAQPDWPGAKEASVLRLLRWPPAHMLRAPGRLKLATLMTGRPMSLHMLQLNSGQSMAACKNFLNDLHHARLLRDESQPAAALPVVTPVQRNPTPAVTLGLLARIRLRLGLHGAGGAGQPRMTAG